MDVNGIRARENLRSFCMIQPFLGRVKKPWLRSKFTAMHWSVTRPMVQIDMICQEGVLKQQILILQDISRWIYHDLSDLSPTVDSRLSMTKSLRLPAPSPDTSIGNHWNAATQGLRKKPQTRQARPIKKQFGAAEDLVPGFGSRLPHCEILGFPSSRGPRLQG